MPNKQYKEPENHIVYNAIQTPDGTVLVSKHVHDYVTHSDKNGEVYMNDGGNAYIRRSVNKEPYTDLTVYTDDPHEEIRKVLLWGSYGIKGDEPLKFNVLKDMSGDHIKNIIATITHIPEWHMNIFIDELAWREKNDP